MAGTDQHPDGRNGSTQSSNVVHLRPRQWLESEDELIPIGGASPEPGAGANPTSDRPADHASTWLGAGEETVPIALDAGTEADTGADESPSWAASDFWGEDAAHLHDALEAPVPPPRPSETSRTGLRLPATARRIPRASALTAVAIAAAAITAGIIGGFGSAPGETPASSLHTNAAAHSVSRAATGNAAATATARLRPTAAASRHRSTQRAHRRVRPNRAHVRARSTSFSRAHARYGLSRPPQPRTVPVAPTAVRYVAPAPTNSTTDAPTRAKSASSSAHAGPTGTAALIGAGTSPSG